MMTDKFRLLFFGSDLFSSRVLGHLIETQICAIQVVTRPHTVLDRYAAQQQLKRHSWQEGLANVDQSSYNIGLVASFGNLIDNVAVRKFKYGLFNVHPSLLPQYRGSTPVQTSVFENIRETGCTIMQIPPVEKFDIGDILLQERLEIRHREFAIDLMVRLADLGGRMAVNFLHNYESCMKLARPQGSDNKSLARKLKPEQGQLKFKSETRDLIDRKVRAFSGFIDIYINCLGGLFVRLDGMLDPQHEVDHYDLDQLAENLNSTARVKDSDETNVIKNYAEKDEIPAGLMYFHKVRRLICIKCADNKWHAFEWATPGGKPRMSALDFYNGYLSKVSLSDRITDV